MRKNQVILISIGVLILVGLASGFSYWLGQKSVAIKDEVAVLNFLKSKMVQNWDATASGEITGISNRTLTLSKNGETLNIPILEEAKINSLSSEGGEKKLENIGFGDIKVGDGAEIRLGVNQEGNFIGVFVTVLH